jgi:hypothetical protein
MASEDAMNPVDTINPEDELSVEITLDNWNDFFEEKDVVVVSYNAFDEVDRVRVLKTIAIRDEYVVDAEKSDVAIEVEGVFTDYYYVNINEDTWTIEYLEKKDDHEWYDKFVESFEMYNFNATDFGYSVHFNRPGDDYVFDLNSKPYVERYTIKEIMRIKGTLYYWNK